MHPEHSAHAGHADRLSTDARERWLAAQWSFIAAALPAAPARIVEIGCGSVGGIVPTALSAGYEAVGVDPDAPKGAAYRRVPFEHYETADRVDAVVSCQALHHLPDLDAAFARIHGMLGADGRLVVVEWAWERIDEATARWCFARTTSADDAGWAQQQRQSWQASGQPWPQYLAGWAREHGLHSWQDVASALAARFDTLSCTDTPALFGDIPAITEPAERAAIASGEIAATGVHYVGRPRSTS
jgi:SAM-dependent methyltransferase